MYWRWSRQHNDIPKIGRWEDNEGHDVTEGNPTSEVHNYGSVRTDQTARISSALFNFTEGTTFSSGSSHTFYYNVDGATGNFTRIYYADGKHDKKGRWDKTGHCTVESVEGQVGSPTQMTAATQQQAADEIAQQEKDQKGIRSERRAATFNQIVGVLSDPNNNPNNTPIGQANAQAHAMTANNVHCGNVAAGGNDNVQLDFTADSRRLSQGAELQARFDG